MAKSTPRVVHVVGADTPVWKLGVLEALCASSAGVAGWQGQTPKPVVRAPVHDDTGRSATCPWHPAVVHVGRGALPGPLSVPVGRVRAPLDLASLGVRMLSHALDSLGDQSRGPLVLQVWSATALTWCLPLATAADRRGRKNQPQRRCWLLVEMDGASNAEPFARRYRSRPTETRLAFTCPTATVRRRLLENGVAAEDCVVIREFVDFAALNQARNRNVRAELGLDASETVVAALPPVVGGSGTFTVAWAALLLSKMHPGVRLLIPGVGPEADRVQHLVDSIRHRHVARIAPRLSLPELVAAADLTAYLPNGDATVTGLIWAMAAARPIIATAVPAVAELLGHGHNAWLCRPNSPKDAARRMLQALERPDESQRQAELARSQVFQVFGRQRMIEQYAQAYANLAAGRDMGVGIRDSAMIS
jgi:hypothetical protein